MRVEKDFNVFETVDDDGDDSRTAMLELAIASSILPSTQEIVALFAEAILSPDGWDGHDLHGEPAATSLHPMLSAELKRRLCAATPRQPGDTGEGEP